MEELLQDRPARLTADAAAPAWPAAPRWPRRRAAWRPDWTLLAGPALTLAVTAWGIGTRSYWGDEADTISAVSRSLPALGRLLRHVDAVHGLYYLLLWPVVRVAGTGEVVTRLPSAVAMAATAAGVAAIARRLASSRAALCAGLVFALLPTVSLQGHDARPYAIVTAGATAASYLLLRVAADPRPRWLAGYAVALALTGYLQLFGLLLVPAHAVTLAWLFRRRAGAASGRGVAAAVLRGWLLAVAAAVALVAPVAVAAWLQRAQVSWIPRPGWKDAGNLVTTLGGGPAAATVLGLLAVIGVAARERPGAGGPGASAARPVPARPRAEASHPGRAVAWLAGPWLALPPLLLIALSEAQPVYNGRYVTYCLPAAALLAGTGLAALPWPGPAALGLLAALCLPLQLAARTPGSPIQAAGNYLAHHERPGDAIIYPGAFVPPWSLASPAGFTRLRDLSLAQPPAAAGQLYGTAVTRPMLIRRERGVYRIWVVQMGRGHPGPASYLAPGFRLARRWAPGRRYLRIKLYVRTASTHVRGR